MDFNLPHLAVPIVPALIGCLLYWIIVRRMRRNIDRQKLRPLRSIISIVILLLVSLALFTASQLVPKLISGIGAGLLGGGLLGLFGLRLTKFETTEAGNFYTPDKRIGIALTLLFVVRLIYRFWALRVFVGAAHAPPPPFKSALTYLIFGLLAGYHIVYQFGLLFHGRGKNSSAKNYASRP
jgi:hypothetical protein